MKNNTYFADYYSGETLIHTEEFIADNLVDAKILAGEYKKASFRGVVRTKIRIKKRRRSRQRKNYMRLASVAAIMKLAKIMDKKRKK